MEDLNKYIKKSHLRMVEKFNDDLEAFRIQTEAEAAELYEDINTSFTLANVRVSNGNIVFEYDGKAESHPVVLEDYETGEVYEDELDGIVEWVKFWRKCLNRAKKYWSMSPETLDAISDGEKEDIEEED